VRRGPNVFRYNFTRSPRLAATVGGSHVRAPTRCRVTRAEIGFRTRWNVEIGELQALDVREGFHDDRYERTESKTPDPREKEILSSSTAEEIENAAGVRVGKREGSGLSGFWGPDWSTVAVRVPRGRNHAGTAHTGITQLT